MQPASLTARQQILRGMMHRIINLIVQISSRGWLPSVQKLSACIACFSSSRHRQGPGLKSFASSQLHRPPSIRQGAYSIPLQNTISSQQFLARLLLLGLWQFLWPSGRPRIAKKAGWLLPVPSCTPRLLELQALDARRDASRHLRHRNPSQTAVQEDNQKDLY